MTTTTAAPGAAPAEATTTTERTTTSPPSSPLPPGRPDSGAADVHLGELYERHGRTVLGLCRLLLRDPDEAEDAAQQVFLSALRSLRAGAEPRFPAAWLATIARNECWGRIRRRGRELPAGAAAAVELPDPVEAALRKADLTALWRAVAELPAHQREALLLRELGGLSYEELAEALSVSQPGVESLLVRARRTLRLRLRPAAMAGLAPLLAVREAVARLAALGDAPEAAAKLAAGAAAVSVAGGAVVAVEPGLVTGKPPWQRRPVVASMPASTGEEEKQAAGRGRPGAAAGGERAASALPTGREEGEREGDRAEAGGEEGDERAGNGREGTGPGGGHRGHEEGGGEEIGGEQREESRASGPGSGEGREGALDPGEEEEKEEKEEKEGSSGAGKGSRSSGSGSQGGASGPSPRGSRAGSLQERWGRSSGGVASGEPFSQPDGILGSESEEDRGSESEKEREGEDEAQEDH